MGKTNGARNRNAGHSFEREIVQILNSFPILPEVGTARELSTQFDKEGKVDIVTRSIMEIEKLGIVIQAKNSVVKADYPKLLSELKFKCKNILKINKFIPVVFHKQTEKSGTRFMTRDKFAILYLDDFIKVYTDFKKYKKGYEILNTRFDHLDDTEKKVVNKELSKIDL